MVHLLNKKDLSYLSSKVPPFLRFCLKCECVDASPFGHLSINPCNGAKSFDQQGPAVSDMRHLRLRHLCFLLYCNYGFSLRILMRLSIDAFHFDLILGRLNPNFLLHHWSICQVVVGKDGRPQVFSSMNSVFEPHPTMLAMLLATFQFFTLEAALKQFGITWAGLYVTWLWVQSYCFLFSWSSLSQEMLFLFAAFVAWLMTVSAFASIYTQQPGHALDVVLIPRAWNMTRFGSSFWGHQQHC